MSHLKNEKLHKKISALVRLHISIILKMHLSECSRQRKTDIRNRKRTLAKGRENRSGGEGRSRVGGGGFGNSIFPAKSAVHRVRGDIAKTENARVPIIRV